MTALPLTPSRTLGRGARTQQTVLEAAVARFGRDGFRATSVADIAREAGVGPSVPFTYYPNKEALFLAAVDHDAAAVIHEGLSAVFGTGASGGMRVPLGADPPGLDRPGRPTDWRQALIFTCAAGVETHPLARRVLAGLEPEVTDRVLEVPALAELRRACAARILEEQAAGSIRTDIDAVAVANGTVTIMLSLLMSMVQIGGAAALAYGADVAAVFDAALSMPGSSRSDTSPD